jgi:putative DNA primase/helicase
MAAPLRITPPSTLKDIVLGTDLERVTNEAIEAISKDQRVFQRGGSLVGVVTIPEGPAKPKEAISRSPGSPVIRPLQFATVRERLAANANWLKLDGRTKQHKQTIPPEYATSGVMARGEWGGVRTLVSVVTSPSMRPDGTVLQDPGYDVPTATLYWPRETYVQVIDNPGIDDARGAVAALREVVCDFPFARPEHESAWIAGLLTMLARPAIDGCVPLFAVDATTRGTGKSRLVDAATRIATGSDAARTAFTDDDTEMRKRITALVLEGDPAILLDNIPSGKPIALASLDNVITTRTWKDRLLGASTNVGGPAQGVWWATGNNLIFGADLSRRAIHIRLRSPLENPEERVDFKHPELLKWLEQSRRKLVACALTILRAYVVAGRPKMGCSIWGSFEEWSSLVPPALVWAGMPDPLLARATREGALDEDRSDLLVLLEYLARFPRPLTVREILESMYGNGPDKLYADDARDVIEGATRAKPGQTPDARRVGKLLQKHRERVVQGMRLAQAGVCPSTKKVLWTVERVTP